MHSLPDSMKKSTRVRMQCRNERICLSIRDFEEERLIWRSYSEANR